MSITNGNTLTIIAEYLEENDIDTLGASDNAPTTGVLIYQKDNKFHVYISIIRETIAISVYLYEGPQHCSSSTHAVDLNHPESLTQLTTILNNV